MHDCFQRFEGLMHLFPHLPLQGFPPFSLLQCVPNAFKRQGQMWWMCYDNNKCHFCCVHIDFRQCEKKSRELLGGQAYPPSHSKTQRPRNLREAWQVKKREKKRNCMSNVYVDCLTSAFSIFKIEANLFLKKVLKAKGEKTYIPVYNLVRLRCP